MEAEGLEELAGDGRDGSHLDGRLELFRCIKLTDTPLCMQPLYLAEVVFSCIPVDITLRLARMKWNEILCIKDYRFESSYSVV
jgi:hypothetical protein